MVMHPAKPELNGQDLTDHKDPNGKQLFVEFVNVVRKHDLAQSLRHLRRVPLVSSLASSFNKNLC